jgi:hypothetical protein
LFGIQSFGIQTSHRIFACWAIVDFGPSFENSRSSIIFGAPLFYLWLNFGIYFDKNVFVHVLGEFFLANSSGHPARLPPKDLFNSFAVRLVHHLAARFLATQILVAHFFQFLHVPTRVARFFLTQDTETE